MRLPKPPSAATNSATITRFQAAAMFTRKVSMATRTMITEVEVPNPDLALIPGMYATVVLKLHRHPGALAVPVEAVNAVGNPTVTVVSPDGTLCASGGKDGDVSGEG